jgi:hypothetical protein
MTNAAAGRPRPGMSEERRRSARTWSEKCPGYEKLLGVRRRFIGARPRVMPIVHGGRAAEHLAKSCVEDTEAGSFRHGGMMDGARDDLIMLRRQLLAGMPQRVRERAVLRAQEQRDEATELEQSACVKRSRAHA